MKFLLAIAATVAAAVGGYLKYPAKVLDGAISLQRRVAGLTHRTRVVDGYTWHYLEGGTPDGVPLVMIHGFAGNKDNWALVARALGKNHRIICPDLPGFGDSERRFDLSYDTATQADRVHEFLLALGIDKAHIAGNSMGGMITLQLALRHPELPLSLALLDSAGTSSVEPNAFQIAVENGETPLAVRTLDDVDRALDLATYRTVRLPKKLKQVFFEDIKEREELHDQVFGEIAEEATEGGLDDEIAAITQPVLIMWGREDQILDVSCTELLDERIARSRVEILDKTGHVPMMERPREAARIHADFLADVAAGRI